MEKIDALVAEFEKAVEPEVGQLTQMAHDFGSQATAEKARRPDVDPWMIPQAEMQHCINNALNILGAVMLGEFERVGEGIGRYSERVRGLENQLAADPRPSDLLDAIKRRIEDTVRGNPDVLGAAGPDNSLHP